MNAYAGNPRDILSIATNIMMRKATPNSLERLIALVSASESQMTTLPLKDVEGIVGEVKQFTDHMEQKMGDPDFPHRGDPNMLHAEREIGRYLTIAKKVLEARQVAA